MRSSISPISIGMDSASVFEVRGQPYRCVAVLNTSSAECHLWLLLVDF
uniref:Uncharacterized protein n=1 Tax=Anguilla anguilla TaxID=7936 RepID=A0A0E9QF23_ANGAN